MNVGTKELLGLSSIVEETIESLDISKAEKELMYEIILIEKQIIVFPSPPKQFSRE